MEKIRPSPFSFLFPWLSPLVIRFTVVNNGVEIQLYKHNRLCKNWHPSQLGKILPLQLIRWIEGYHMHLEPQPYPLVRQLWRYLTPFVSKKLLIDSSDLAKLKEVGQPQDFAVTWTLDHSSLHIEGHYEGTDCYLGMGWFQKGAKVWSLKETPSATLDEQLRNLTLPVQQVDLLLKSIIPGLQPYLPVHVDFQLINDFAVHVLVPDARSENLILLLDCNYPRFLSTMRIPQQPVDILLADQAVIRFPRQALTPVLAQLLQGNASIRIRGSAIPQFISDELPVMRRFLQISDEMAAKITRSNPIVPVATLKPISTLTHRYEQGVGKYSMTATYQYQHHALDMDALIATRQQNQRFVLQHGIWFEWPYNSRELVNTILHQRTPQVLRPEEVMGFDTQRIALLQDQPIASAIQPDGTTPAARGQSVVEQLRRHGVPGGIIGDPKGIIALFVSVCENLWRENRQARILWLTPSSKKGPVTRAVHGSTIASCVTVASLVTLRDEPTFLAHTWTLVIFQEVDLLLDGSYQSRNLPRLAWKWALLSVASKQALNAFLMQALHLPGQYYEQFCARYLFDVERSSENVVTGQRASGPKTARSPGNLPIDLDQQKIARLHEESEQLQERLVFEIEEEQPGLFDSLPELEAVLADTVNKIPLESVPDMDEDWQVILQKWRPEHWEIIQLVCQEQPAQMVTVERRVHRPVSRLIDEVNNPVEEQLGDLLVDPETQTLSPHLRARAESLVHWYFASTEIGRHMHE